MTTAFPKLVSLIVMSLFLAGCIKEPELPNGYIFGRTTTLPKDKFLITDRHGKVVVPYSVSRIGITSNYVFGEVEKATPPPGLEGEEAIWSKPGYFILNTLVGDVELELKEGDWQTKLLNCGITNFPKLIDSSAFIYSTRR